MTGMPAPVQKHVLNLEPHLKQPAMFGAHILHVEDEVLIALEVESICRENGAAEVTHISDLEEAEASDPGRFDVAVVDLSLRGRSTIPFAEKLLNAGVPLVFMSGLEPSAVKERFPAAQFVAKPFLTGGVVEAIARALASKSPDEIRSADDLSSRPSSGI